MKSSYEWAMANIFSFYWITNVLNLSLSIYALMTTTYTMLIEVQRYALYAKIM